MTKEEESPCKYCGCKCASVFPDIDDETGKDLYRCDTCNKCGHCNNCGCDE